MVDTQGKNAPADKGKMLSQNPELVRYGIELAKKKKKEAVEKEDYENAAKLQKKIKELEEQLEKLEAGGAEMPQEEGQLRARPGAKAKAMSDPEKKAELDRRVAELRKRLQAGKDITEDEDKPVSFLTNPFKAMWKAVDPLRTARVLRNQGGFGTWQTGGLLLLIYATVFALEVLLLRAAWGWIGPPRPEGEETGGSGVGLTDLIAAAFKGSSEED